MYLRGLGRQERQYRRKRQTGNFVDDWRRTRFQRQCGGRRNHSGRGNKKDEPESNDPMKGLQEIQTMRGAGKCSIEESGTCERKAVGKRGEGKEELNGQRGAIRDDKRSGDDLPMRLGPKRHLPFTVRCCRDSLFTFKN